MRSPPTTDKAAGTRCASSARRRAVTMTSGRPPSRSGSLAVVLWVVWAKTGALNAGMTVAHRRPASRFDIDNTPFAAAVVAALYSVVYRWCIQPYTEIYRPRGDQSGATGSCRRYWRSCA
ncbi:hypothetical protein WR25_13986 [Diploscapter pachys]|uniref:Uncharacterized protein n=1 Tax=Diploscapter pachys TaxID=2018661 RepID=A0A2A2JZU1_9BILA|nr:hypothetical protein WR25_13986 [Diploscapter pachys]